MKTARMLAMLSLALLPSAAIHAADTKEADYVARAKTGPGIPVPVSVVAPATSASPGDYAEVVLTVDAAGRPTDVAVKSASDRAFGQAAREAVKRWRFAPATVDGKPAAVKVLVPFTVASDDARRSTYASTR